MVLNLTPDRPHPRSATHPIITRGHRTGKGARAKKAQTQEELLLFVQRDPVARVALGT